MFSLLIMIFVYAFFISLIIGTLTLLAFRIYFSYQNQLHWKKALFVMFVPCSIGFYLTIKEKTKLTTLYRYLVVFFFVVTFIASIFVLYMHLGLDII